MGNWTDIIEKIYFICLLVIELQVLFPAVFGPYSIKKWQSCTTAYFYCFCSLLYFYSSVMVLILLVLCSAVFMLFLYGSFGFRVSCFFFLLWFTLCFGVSSCFLLQWCQLMIGFTYAFLCSPPQCLVSLLRMCLTCVSLDFPICILSSPTSLYVRRSMGLCTSSFVGLSVYFLCLLSSNLFSLMNSSCFVQHLVFPLDWCCSCGLVMVTVLGLCRIKITFSPLDDSAPLALLVTWHKHCSAKSVELLLETEDMLNGLYHRSVFLLHTNHQATQTISLSFRQW